MESKFHFTVEYELMLLRQAICDRPFDAEWGNSDSLWKKVAESLKIAGLKAETRTFRDHFNKMVKDYRLQERVSRKKSGTNEEYTEMEQLLTEILEIMNSKKENIKQKKNDKIINSQTAAKIREDATLKMSQKRSIDNLDIITNKKNKKEDLLLSVVMERNKKRQEEIEREFKLRGDEIENEKERLAIERRKLDLEERKLEEERIRSEKRDEMLFSLIKSANKK